VECTIIYPEEVIIEDKKDLDVTDNRSRNDLSENIIKE
jgi:hypothetical protein